MIKQIYKKNGYIIVNNENNLKMNYFIINHYDGIKDINKLKKDYYKSIGFTYQD